MAWETPAETQRFMSGEISRYKVERSRWERDMGNEAEKSGEKRLLEMLQVERTKAVDGEVV